jgi:hypothetical protein
MDHKLTYVLLAVCSVPALFLLFGMSFSQGSYGGFWYVITSLVLSPIFGVIGLASLAYSARKGGDKVFPGAATIIAFFPLFYFIFSKRHGG